MKEKRIKVRAAGLVVRNNKILLLNHRKNGKSYWVLPGGGVEFNERARSGLEREFREELGIRINAGDLAFTDEVVLPEGRHNIDLYFHCTAGSFKRVKLEEGSAVSGYGFFSAGEVKKMDIRPPLKRELVRIISDESASARFFSF